MLFILQNLRFYDRLNQLILLIILNTSERNDLPMKRFENGAFLLNGNTIAERTNESDERIAECSKNTISYSILKSHDISDDKNQLKIKFDAITSHDITYVGIIQTARASGMKEFPLPYVLTNCHNSLCAVGGTINEDDHLFGLSAVKKYGGIYVPAHQAVIHQYMREMMAGCGKMILGSDSHTRYGAIGTMAVGEGGPELVKQLLGDTYDIQRPKIAAVYLDGSPRVGVGPQDVALAIIKDVFADGFVKNCVMEFVGPGIKNLSMDFRCGVDVMTTETTCLSSIWETDEKTREYLAIHGRENEYKKLSPNDCAWYDKLLYVNLSEIEPMIAMPFHPSNAFTISELNKNPYDILSHVQKNISEQFGGLSVKLLDNLKDGKLYVDQGVIAGCAGGGYENICEAAHIIGQNSIGNSDFALSVYPASQPVMMQLVKNGTVTSLMSAGATIRSAFCGPCFGAGDVPANTSLSIRHTTRNFPNREGSKPTEGQLSAVALMDARSIAATAANKGFLTSACDMLDKPFKAPAYFFDKSSYDSRCYYGFKKANPDEPLRFGPNIADWPEQSELKKHAILRVCSVINDPVTTTDELIPSGETSSYRSNPLRLAQFTLSRKDPQYTSRAADAKKQAENISSIPEWKDIVAITNDTVSDNYSFGSTIWAVKPGDGSAREQAASCQRVLGGLANICSEYATKRYRSNLINWGMLPLRLSGGENISFNNGDCIVIPNADTFIKENLPSTKAYLISNQSIKEFTVTVDYLTELERQIILSGCLINFNRNKNSVK